MGCVWPGMSGTALTLMSAYRGPTVFRFFFLVRILLVPSAHTHPTTAHTPHTHCGWVCLHITTPVVTHKQTQTDSRHYLCAFLLSPKDVESKPAYVWRLFCPEGIIQRKAEEECQPRWVSVRTTLIMDTFTLWMSAWMVVSFFHPILISDL